jgi:SAM-dependent methyltransferase
MRKQLVETNKGITDYNPSDPNHSLTRRGYAHHSGTEFTEEFIGSFGEWIANLVENSLVVELGCGSAVLSRYCKYYIGLDGNKDAGNCCKGEFYVLDLTEPYSFDPPIEADFIISFNFLEHIEEELIPKLLAQADSLLKPGGRLFLVADHSKQETGEHVTIKGEDWWDQQFSNAGWIKDEITAEFKNSYFSHLPLHWKSWGLGGFQMIFLYHKEK